MSPSDISSTMRCPSRSAWLSAMSTPISGVNIQAFLGFLTRAIVRGTWNSNRARLVTTRFVSSAPVTAATTFAWRMPAASSTAGSVPSPARIAPGGRSRRSIGISPGNTSTSLTLCPAERSSAARYDPTLPPPTTITFIAMARPPLPIAAPAAS